MPYNPNLTLKRQSLYLTEEQWLNPPDNRNEKIESQIIPQGAVVEYAGHTVGGMIKVRHAGEVVVIHPGATDL